MPFPVDESFIVALETELGVRLPDCYGSWMMDRNGGTIFLAEDDWELHPVQDTSDRKRISRTANHVLKEQAAYQDWIGAKPDTLSIATNGCGDHLVLMKQGDRYLPEVYRWDHKTGNLLLCASSIQEAVRE